MALGLPNNAESAVQQRGVCVLSKKGAQVALGGWVGPDANNL